LTPIAPEIEFFAGKQNQGEGKMKVLLSLVASSLLSISAFAVSFDSDVPVNIQNQMKQDLSFMETIQGSGQTRLHQEIFGTVDGATYKNFFENHINSIGKDDCGNGNAVACVYSFLGKRMFITDNYIKFEHPQIARLMVVYHEARHTEREHGNWSHAICPTPFLGEDGKEILSIWTGATLAGEAACDITPRGSYGSSTILIENISKFCSNCNEKVKMDADIYAMDQMKRITDASAKAEMKKDFESAL
jgi:hypothetical protein